jgi:hypothetical protein
MLDTNFSDVRLIAQNRIGYNKAKANINSIEGIIIYNQKN